MIENGEVEMIVSSVHHLENSASPEVLRREWVSRFLKVGSIHLSTGESIRVRAQEIQMDGLKPLDALHLSSAEAAEANYFLTCDDRLVRRYRGPMKVMGPQEFISDIERL